MRNFPYDIKIWCSSENPCLDEFAWAAVNLDSFILHTWVPYNRNNLCFRFIKGFMTRNQPVNKDNSEYLAFVRHNYLMRLKDNLPKSVLDRHVWPTPPPIMKEVSSKDVEQWLQAATLNALLHDIQHDV